MLTMSATPRTSSLAAWSRVRQGCMGGVERSLLVDRDRPLPLLDVRTDDGPEEHAPGVLDEAASGDLPDTAAGAVTAATVPRSLRATPGLAPTAGGSLMTSMQMPAGRRRESLPTGVPTAHPKPVRSRLAWKSVSG